ncbi:helix-turn-helix domain-containing protein [Streptomyces sp. NPDC090026]|uniref:helix-turn-helix domain-containing protein n=1 Tax=Streptomyces sp. NPDC090026 TaxID=3365923 RepID=UPI003823E5D0
MGDNTVTEPNGENLPQPPRSLDEERRDFAHRLKDLRTQTGMSQQECADLINVNKSTISNYERDENPNLPPLEYPALLIQEARRRSNLTPDVLHDAHRTYGHLLKRLAESGSNALYQQMWSVFNLTEQREELVAEIGTVHHQLQGVMAERDRYRQAVHDGQAPDPAQEQRLEERIQQLELRRTALVSQRDGITAQLDALNASQAQPVPHPNAAPTPPPAAPDLGVVPPQHPLVAALPSGNPGTVAAKNRTVTKIVTAVAVVALALGGFLIYRVTEPDATTASPGSSPEEPSPSSQPTTPTPLNTPSPTPEITPVTDPTDTENDPEQPAPNTSAPLPPEEDGYLVTWNAEHKTTNGLITIDLKDEPRARLGTDNDLYIQSNDGVDPYITPGQARSVSLGVVPSGDPIPGPSECSEIARNQLISRHKLASGNRYCVKAGETIGHFEVINVKRTGELSIFLIRWQPS